MVRPCECEPGRQLATEQQDLRAAGTVVQTAAHTLSLSDLDVSDEHRATQRETCVQQMEQRHCWAAHHHPLRLRACVCHKLEYELRLARQLGLIDRSLRPDGHRPPNLPPHHGLVSQGTGIAEHISHELEPL
eukprot:3931578-Prymnesium_polylepis.1